MANDEGRDQARKAVADALVEAGLTPTEFARRADIDADTVTYFLDGRRWPQAGTRNAISRALGWTPSSVDRVARGEDPIPVEGEEIVGPVREAPRVLLDIDPEVYDAMDPISQRRAKAEAEAAFYRIAQEARRRANDDQ